MYILSFVYLPLIIIDFIVYFSNKALSKGLNASSRQEDLCMSEDNKEVGFRIFKGLKIP